MSSGRYAATATRIVRSKVTGRFHGGLTHFSGETARKSGSRRLFVLVVPLELLK